MLLDVAIDERPLRRVVGDQDVMGRQLTRLVQSQRVASPVLDQSGGACAGGRILTSEYVKRLFVSVKASKGGDTFGLST